MHYKLSLGNFAAITLTCGFVSPQLLPPPALLLLCTLSVSSVLPSTFRKTFLCHIYSNLKAKLKLRKTDSFKKMFLYDEKKNLSVLKRV